jgi:hypothetical protein
MQDTIAGNKNAGNVMRKKTPREHKMPNENAAQDTLACTSLAHYAVNDATRVCLKVRIITRLQLTRTASMEFEKVCV